MQVGTGKNPTTPLFSDTKNFFFEQNNIKVTKKEHAFKGLARTYNVEISSYFNPELQLKDTESAIKNKLQKLLSKLEDLNLGQH